MIRLQLFGALDLRNAEGSEIRSVLAQPKRIALLAYLACATPRRFHRRDTLLALFWPELDETRARGALNTAIYQLRRSLGGGAIANRGDQELRLAPEQVWCDVVAFEEATRTGKPEQALELYGGELLPGFFVSDVPEFESWLEGERSRLRARAAEAAWQLVSAAEDSGDADRLVQLARRAVRLSRDEEPAVRKLIALLGRLGDLEGALRTYEQLAARLALEYDAEPAAETRAVAEAAHAAARARALAPSPPPPPPTPGVPAVVGERLSAPAQPVPALAASPERAENRGDSAVPAGPAAAAPGPPAGRRGGGPRAGRRGLSVVLLATVLLVAATAILSRVRPGPAPPTSSDVIAVLPFSYYGGEARSLEEGIVRLLSTNLDGAGEVRSVDPRALLSVLEQTDADPSDPESGRALAEHFGAGLFVLGHIVEAGGQMRITAVIYDRNGPPGGAPLEQVTVEGDSGNLLALVDELTTKLLANHSGEPRTRIAQTAARTTHSLPALRAFLDGERHYRRARYAEAVEAFRRAAGLDSTFALAHYRMSTAAIWASDWAADALGREGAMRFRERLAPRDRQLVEAWDRYSREPTAEVEQLYERLIARDPDDVEAWFQLGETRFHWKPMYGYPVLEAREPFERVLSYEPDNAAALIHLARLAALERDTAHFDALFERIRRLDPGWDEILELEALRAFTVRDRAAQAQLRQRLAVVDPEVRVRILYAVATYTGDLEGTAAAARQLPEIDSEPTWSAAMHILLAQLEAGRGRWHAAREELTALERLRPSWATHHRSVLGTLPFLHVSATEIESIRSEVAGMPTSSATPNLDADWSQPAVMYTPGQLYLLGLLSVRMHDPVAALRYAGELERQAATVDAAYGRIFARLLRAEIARVGGQTADAMKALGKAPGSAVITSAPPWRFANAHERFLRAGLLQALGREKEALQQYTSFPAPSAYDLIYLAPSHLRRAEIYERLGRRELALEHNRRFVELWQDADPELQPTVDAARRKLAQAGGKAAAK